MLHESNVLLYSYKYTINRQRKYLLAVRYDICVVHGVTKTTRWEKILLGSEHHQSCPTSTHHLLAPTRHQCRVWQPGTHCECQASVQGVTAWHSLW